MLHDYDDDDDNDNMTIIILTANLHNPESTDVKHGVGVILVLRSAVE